MMKSDKELELEQRRELCFAMTTVVHGELMAVKQGDAERAVNCSIGFFEEFVKLYSHYFGELPPASATARVLNRGAYEAFTYDEKTGEPVL